MFGFKNERLGHILQRLAELEDRVARLENVKSPNERARELAEREYNKYKMDQLVRKSRGKDS